MFSEVVAFVKKKRPASDHSLKQVNVVRGFFYFVRVQKRKKTSYPTNKHGTIDGAKNSGN
jgi:hypothetical protein